MTNPATPEDDLAKRPTQPAAAHVAAVDGLLSEDGWAYASSMPVDATDPGRFHALFGRDSLIFALQTLGRRPEIAASTLRALARLQGTVVDPAIEEQPGRIVHEYRPVAPEWLVAEGWPLRDGGIRYYGTSDATSWFLVVLAETRDAQLQAELADHRRAAGDWLEYALDAGGGFVRCGPRHYPGGLSQQGWRDSHDPVADGQGGGIVLEDGSAPQPPLADLDSQAVAVAALDALTVLDPDRRQQWIERADQLRTRIRGFVSADRVDVMAVDGLDRPVSGAGTQLGWLLWAGALDDAGAAAAAARLAQPDILTAYGARTLADSHPAFLAQGYHRGAVWPFDNWIVWAGLRRAGAVADAAKVRDGVRRGVARLGLYPELYAVSPQGEPVLIPVANRTQAWTVGAMVAFGDDGDACPTAGDANPPVGSASD